jgi:hypothetical protein
MRTHIYSSMRTHIYRSMRTHIYSSMTTHVYSSMRTHIHSSMRTHIHSSMRTHIYTSMRTHINSSMRTHLTPHLRPSMRPPLPPLPPHLTAVCFVVKKEFPQKKKKVKKEQKNLKCHEGEVRFVLRGMRKKSGAKKKMREKRKCVPRYVEAHES